MLIKDRVRQTMVFIVHRLCLSLPSFSPCCCYFQFILVLRRFNYLLHCPLVRESKHSVLQGDVQWRQCVLLRMFVNTVEQWLCFCWSMIGFVCLDLISCWCIEPLMLLYLRLTSTGRNVSNFRYIQYLTRKYASLGLRKLISAQTHSAHCQPPIALPRLLLSPSLSMSCLCVCPSVVCCCCKVWICILQQFLCSYSRSEIYFRWIGGWNE